MIGKTISHYKIVEKLGEGGMGVVYRAFDTRLDRHVAIKFLPTHLQYDDQAKKRFVHEAKAASALNHPHIGVIHEIDYTSDGQLFIVMAYYKGQTLREKINAGPISIDEAIEIGCQISSGLAAAHAKDILHRDVKPANILLTERNEAELVDFGLAKLAGQTRVTKTGTTVGTVAYMSPESAAGAESTSSSDVFSLGVVLYELLTGDVPFKGEHDAAVLYGIMHSDPANLSERSQDIPPELARIVDKALKKNPGERYPSATELTQDLEALRATSRSNHSTPAPPNGKQKRWWIGVAAAVVVIAAGVFFINKTRIPSPASASEMSLAVLDFRDMRASTDTIATLMLAELLNTALVEPCPVRVQSPEYLREIRRRIFGSTSNRLEEGQELKVAREGNATYALAGRIGNLDGQRFVTWRLIDVNNGESVGAGRVESARMSAIVDEIVAAVLPRVAQRSGFAQPMEQVPVEKITTASASAYEHFMLGRLKRSHRRLEEAVQELKSAVAIDSTFALAWLEMARFYFGPDVLAWDITLARQYAGTALRHESRLDIKNRMHLKAFWYGLDQNAVLEMATLEEISERWPDDRETLQIVQARAYWWWDNNLAVATARRGLELYPEDLYLGGAVYSSALRELGRPEEAYAAAKQYMRKFPENTNAWDEVALCYLALGHPDSAEAAYNRAYKLDPNWGVENLAYCAYQSGDVERAISMLEHELTRTDLSDARRVEIMLYYTHVPHLIAFYYVSGRYSDAMKTIADGWQYVVGDPSFWQYQAGSLFTAIGRPDRALKIAAEMEQSKEVRARRFAFRFKGQAQVAAGDLIGARVTLARLRELTTTLGNLMEYLVHDVESDIALAENDPASALEALESMSRISNGLKGMIQIEYLVSLARAHEMAGDLEDAVAVHKETLRIYGGHAISHYELGRLYEEMNRPDEAVTHYVKFLEMWKNADEGLPQPEYARKRLATLQHASN